MARWNKSWHEPFLLGKVQDRDWTTDPGSRTVGGVGQNRDIDFGSLDQKKRFENLNSIDQRLVDEALPASARVGYIPPGSAENRSFGRSAPNSRQHRQFRGSVIDRIMGRETTPYWRRYASTMPRLAMHKYKKNVINQFGKNLSRNLRLDLPLAIPFLAIDTIGGAAVEGARWAAVTGDPADYLGGAVTGGVKGMAGSIGGAVGSLVGTVILPGAGSIIGSIAGGVVGYMAGAAALSSPAYALGRFGSQVARTGISKSRIQFGGNFRDSQEAYTMRQLAVQEMAGSLLNARQYLANEAAFFHR